MPELSCPSRSRLDSLAVLTVEGPDAEAFLHGQITNAVQGLPDDQARWAAYCSAQGRMLASLMVWRSGPDTFRLLLAQDLADAVARRLRMFVLRARVQIRIEDTWMVYGQAGAPGSLGPQADAQPGLCGRDAEGDWIIAPAAGPQQRRWQITDQTLPAEPDSSHWQAADLAAGHPWIRSATQDMFLPTTFDMDLNGGIDFQKGCYPGQEVIARTHYRGTVKRRLAYGTAPWTATQGDLPTAGADLYEAAGNDRPIGRIIDCARVGDTVHVAAEITLSDWPAMRYSLVSAQGPALALAPRHTDQSR